MADDRDRPSLINVLAGIAGAWPATLLLVAFALLELANWGILPSFTSSFEAKIKGAEAITAEATAVPARLRKNAEADLATADAQAKSEIARQAERAKRAQAKKADAEARRDQEIARTSPVVKAAELQIEQQKATIAEEQAKHETRLRQAEAMKTAAEAIARDVEASVIAANTRADYIKERTDGIVACLKAYFAKIGPSATGDFSVAISGSDLLGAERRSQQGAFAELRRVCVPENDTPASQLYKPRSNLP